MGKLYATKEDLLLHLTADDIYKISITRVEGGGTNYYGYYDPIHGNSIPIPKELAMDVIDRIKAGMICDIYHTFHYDKVLNF